MSESQDIDPTAVPAGEKQPDAAAAGAPARRTATTMLLYAVSVPLVALIVACFQVYRLQLGRTLPDAYFPAAAAINFAVALACGVAVAPVVWLVFRFWKRLNGLREGEKAALAAVFGVFVPFWLLNAPHGERTSISAFLTPTIMGSAPWAACFTAMLVVLVLVFRRLKGLRFAGASLAIQVTLLCFLLGTIFLQQRAFSRIEDLGLDHSATSRPHVFVILIDTLRADHLSVYGYERPTSPHLEAFAKDSVLFENTFAPAPWTRPSCASVLTGLYPPDFGGLTLHTPLPDSIPILPQFLKEEGYETAGIVSSIHVSPLFGFQKGFDLLDNGETFLRSSGTEEGFEILGALGPAQAYARAGEVKSQAVQWLDGHLPSGDPLFMYLHFKDPHVPYNPPEPFGWRTFASPEAAELPSAREGAEWREKLSPLEAEAMVAAYDGEIRYFDEIFGEFIDYLKAHDAYENSLIVVTADHGEEFNEHGGWAHAHTLYNEVLHVPLIVHYPGGDGGGRRIHHEVSLVDVVPTIEDQLHADWKAHFRGVSLKGVTDQDPPRWIYSDLSRMTGYGWDDDDDPSAVPPGYRAVYLRPHKLIQHIDENQNITDEMYFNYVDDFAEQNPRDPVETLSPDELDAMRSILHETYAGNRSAFEGVEFDPATTKKLKALGYL